MSLIDYKKELRIEIHLLEKSKENKGANKKIENIIGCLIAHACQISFDNGYDGFVSLIPKTEIVNHYIKAYGFRYFGQQLAIEIEASRALIAKYL